jgi:hypothetical protein
MYCLVPSTSTTVVLHINIMMLNHADGGSWWLVADTGWLIFFGSSALVARSSGWCLVPGAWCLVPGAWCLLVVLAVLRLCFLLNYDCFSVYLFFLLEIAMTSIALMISMTARQTVIMAVYGCSYFATHTSTSIPCLLLLWWAAAAMKCSPTHADMYDTDVPFTCMVT